MQLVDQSTGTHGGDEILTRVYKHGNGTDTVQVKVLRNSYDFQSYATASVLTASREWTVIATEPSGNWHTARTPLPQIADQLAKRAEKILA